VVGKPAAPLPAFPLPQYEPPSLPLRRTLLNPGKVFTLCGVAGRARLDGLKGKLDQTPEVHLWLGYKKIPSASEGILYELYR